MRAALTPEQHELADAVRVVLEQACPPDAVRGWADGSGDGPVALRTRLGELGVFGLLVPEDDGGFSLDENWFVPVLEQLGRAAVPLPVAAAVGVAPLLGEAGVDLAAVAAGDLVVAAAADSDASSEAGSGYAAAAPIRATSRGADLLVVGGHGGAGVLTVLDLSAATRQRIAAVDPTQRIESIDGALPVGAVTDPGLVQLAWHRGVLGTSAELIGLARRMLELTVGYVKDRKQFGVPIGSFQAVKHHLADALLATEQAAAVVSAAGAHLAMEPGREHTDRLVSTAKALASDAAHLVSRRTLQCHGAIAYTTEYDLHLFAKRAWAAQREYGSAGWHRRRLAASLLG